MIDNGIGVVVAVGSIVAADLATPGSTKTYTLTATQTDTLKTASAAVTETLDVPPLEILSTRPLPGADTVHRAYTFIFQGSGGLTGQYQWTVDTPPPGLTMDLNSGVLSGIIDPVPSPDLHLQRHPVLRRHDWFGDQTVPTRLRALPARRHDRAERPLPRPRTGSLHLPVPLPVRSRSARLEHPVGKPGARSEPDARRPDHRHADRLPATTTSPFRCRPAMRRPKHPSS
jgi:hypothetical protein